MTWLWILRGWLSRAWTWLKANWKKVLLGVSTLGIGLLFGSYFRKKEIVVSSEIVDAEKEFQAAAEEARKKTEEADRLRDEKILEIGAAHLETVKKLTDTQRARTRDLVDEPEELNDYLLSVGKEMRE